MKTLAAFFLFLFFVIVVPAQTNSQNGSDTTEKKETEVKKETLAKKDELSEVKKDDPKPPLPSGSIAEKKKPFNVPKFSVSPNIDGKLDDEIWKNAVRLEGFVQFQPGDGGDPSKQTVVYLGYDEKFLYIGIHALDDPDKIRATVAQRDQIFGEDNVRILLDTFDDQRRGYLLGFNPLGIQGDGIYTEGNNNGNDTDMNVDILMESKGITLNDGWSVEAKVPFKSLRYTAGKGKFWGVHILRKISRFNNEQDSWMPINRNINGLLVQAGKLTGLDEIKAEKTLEFVPTLTFKETGHRINGNRFSNPPIQPDFGFTLKYSLSSNVTLDAAYNPDFADVEADAPVVEANQRFPIFFEEKRPFFLEGVDIFKTPIFAVNTRQIQNPDVALKLTGKVGKNSFGVMAAVDDPISGNPNGDKAYVGVVRLKRDFGKESHYGFLATSYNFPNKRNQVGGFDVRWKIDDNKTFNAQILGTTSRNYFYNPNLDESTYRTGNAAIYNYEFNNNRKLGGWGFGGVGRTQNYRADVGFTRRTNTNELYAYKFISSDPKPKNFLIRRNLNFNFNFAHDFQGRFQNLNTNVNGNVSLRGSFYTGGGFYMGAEKLIEEEFGPKRGVNPRGILQTGAFFGAADRMAKQTGGWAWAEKNFSKRLYAYINYQMDKNVFDFDFGAGDKYPRVSPAALLNPNNPQDPGTGSQWNINGGADIKPTDSLSFNLNFNKTKLTRNDTGLVAFNSNIFQVKTVYQFSRFVSLKARIDYDTLSSRLRGQYTFGWTPSPGKALYVGYNDKWSNNGYEFNPRLPGMVQLDRTFFIKFSYLFRKSF
ncbi:MAG TPA: DUF5916 domain-containing protein [Pyrinomonadaceae bacterium]|nr:DUF5916 domain-containing protein [Pyrinomonadaceae bacterium]